MPLGLRTAGGATRLQPAAQQRRPRVQARSAQHAGSCPARPAHLQAQRQHQRAYERLAGQPLAGRRIDARVAQRPQPHQRLQPGDEQQVGQQQAPAPAHVQLAPEQQQRQRQAGRQREGQHRRQARKAGAAAVAALRNLLGQRRGAHQAEERVRAQVQAEQAARALLLVALLERCAAEAREGAAQGPGLARRGALHCRRLPLLLPLCSVGHALARAAGAGAALLLGRRHCELRGALHGAALPKGHRQRAL